MSYKSLIWGFDATEVVEVLVEKGSIEIVEWIGKSHKCTIHRDYIYNLRFVDSCTSSKFKNIYFEIYKSSFVKFSLMYKRYDTQNENNIYDSRDIFDLYFNYIINLYNENKVELFMLSCIPHVGIDLLFYEIAKVLNIKTIVLYQSVVPNYFFCMHTFEDFGNFSDAYVLSEKIDRYKIPKNLKKVPIYMKDIKPYKISFLSILKYIIKNKSCQRFWQMYRFKKYQYNLKNIILEPIKNEKYVYFPLQLNPELTTMSLGGEFDDQLLAIEYLSEIIPESWKIYVKENPKQTEFMRGEYFFRRVKNMKNVFFVPNTSDTFQLIENSQFVANVTGTVGWEALGMGKNALIFGRAWYRKLPGVFEYREDLNIEDILSYSIDHQELESETAELLTKMGRGVIDPVYIPEAEGFDPEVNTNNLVEVIKKFL